MHVVENEGLGMIHEEVLIVPEQRPDVEVEVDIMMEELVKEIDDLFTPEAEQALDTIPDQKYVGTQDGHANNWRPRS